MGVSCFFMNAPAETKLEMVERHVSRGDVIIARQRILIERLTNSGISPVEANILLRLFQDIQAAHLLHLARLLKV